jgi:hypothetical protein
MSISTLTNLDCSMGQQLLYPVGFQKLPILEKEPAEETMDNARYYQ